MSGIAALFSGADSRVRLERIARAMDARGPDARALELVPDAGVEGGGLAVTCRAPGEPGAEPAWDPDRRWLVAADGELLNRRALLAELRAWGQEPAAETTAAIVACFCAARSFEAALDRLAGDVALVAWDATERTLWAARDRSGQRPLHYAATQHGILVASELGACLADPDVDRAPDPDAIGEILALGAALPPRTAHRGVRALAPGELLAWGARGLRVRRWWSEAANPPGADGARYRWARSARFAVELAVQQRAQVEAPVAVALSGGVYAEAVLAGTAARRRGPVAALTLLAEPAAVEPRAAEATRRARADHRIIPLLPADVAGILAEVARCGPLVSPEAVAWWRLAAAAFEAGAEVLLTGVGGAALFGGSPFGLADRAAAVPALGVLGRLGRHVQADSWPIRHLRRMGLDAPPGDSLDSLVATAPSSDPTGASLWLERRLAAESTLALVDRACASQGLRASSPFADAPLASLVGTIPIGHLVQVRRPRGLFLDAMEERLAPGAPDHRPMDLPLAAWVAEPALTRGVPEALDGLVPGDAVRTALAGSPRSAWTMMALAAWRRAQG